MAFFENFFGDGDHAPPSSVAAGVTYANGDLVGTLAAGFSLGSGLELAATSDGEGGVTFTVGSELSVTSRIDVYVRRFLGEAGGEMVLAGTRTGLGTIEAELEAGPYLAIAISEGGLTSGGVIFRSNDGQESLHYRCLEAAREFLMQLALPGIDPDPEKHRLVKLPYRPGTEFSGGEGVFYFPDRDDYTPEDNRRDGVVYPVRVVWLRKCTKSLSENLPQLLKQREIMFRAFSGASFLGACEVHTVKVKPGSVVLADAFKNGFDASNVVIEMVTQQYAGII